MRQMFPPKSFAAVPSRRLGSLVNTGSLSSEESDGALSRSVTCCAGLRPASFPACHSFQRIKIIVRQAERLSYLCIHLN